MHIGIILGTGNTVVNEKKIKISPSSPPFFLYLSIMYDIKYISYIYLHIYVIYFFFERVNNSPLKR